MEILIYFMPLDLGERRTVRNPNPEKYIATALDKVPQALAKGFLGMDSKAYYADDNTAIRNDIECDRLVESPGDQLHYCFGIPFDHFTDENVQSFAAQAAPLVAKYIKIELSSEEMYGLLEDVILLKRRQSLARDRYGAASKLTPDQIEELDADILAVKLRIVRRMQEINSRIQPENIRAVGIPVKDVENARTKWRNAQIYLENEAKTKYPKYAESILGEGADLTVRSPELLVSEGKRVELEARVLELHNQINELKKANRHSERQTHEASQKIIQLEQEKATLEQQVLMYRRRYEEAQRNLADARTRTSSLEASSTKDRYKISNLEAALDLQQTQIMDERKAKEAALAEVERLKRELEAAKATPSQAASFGDTVAEVGKGFGDLVITEAEEAAIRKAMARMHHPDVGGDANRMQVWNGLLDNLAVYRKRKENGGK